MSCSGECNLRVVLQVTNHLFPCECAVEAMLWWTGYLIDDYIGALYIT